LDAVPSPTTNIIGDVLASTIDVNKYDIIYHMAAVIGAEKSIQKPLETYRINICGTLNLLKNFKGLFVFPSTAGVYAPLKNPYNLSKYVCEETIRASPCKHLIFRLANLYGEGSTLVVQKWLTADRIQIYGDGNQTRDFIYIDDVTDTLANPFKLELNKTYNLGSGVTTTLNELVKLIIELKGPKEIEYLPAKPFEIYEPTMKPDIKCRTALREGLLKCSAEKPT